MRLYANGVLALSHSPLTTIFGSMHRSSWYIGMRPSMVMVKSGGALLHTPAAYYSRRTEAAHEKT